MPQISFARGIPSPDILPIDELGECARAAAAREGPTILNYGSPGGYGPLREWIAERHGVAPSQVLVTNGSLQAFNLVGEHVLRDGRKTLVEAPTYDRTLASLGAFPGAVNAVPVTSDGLDVDAVADALERPDPPALVYTIPTFQNPTGHTLSLERRRALVELVRGRDVLVYEDDPYRLVRFEGEDLPTLHELAGGDNVVFASSFSKTVAPGIRVGYLVVPEALARPLEALAMRAYISPSTFVQGALFEFIRTGCFEPQLERVRGELRARRDAMLRALERELPDGARWSEPDGGYFLWLDLPDGLAADVLHARASEAGVTFVKGADFYVGAGGAGSARLAFSFASPSEIDEGVARLGRLAREAAAVAA